jgi:hypothetical protein
MLVQYRRFAMEYRGTRKVREVAVWLSMNNYHAYMPREKVNKAVQTQKWRKFLNNTQ